MRLLFACLTGLILGLASPVFPADATRPAKEPALQESFYGVDILDTRAWIVGYYGTILSTKDLGLTWEIQQNPTRSALFQVRFLNENKGWISGSYGTLLATTDGGKNWRPQPTATTEHLFGLTFINERTGWAVGSRGTILHTVDGGHSWSHRSLPQDLTFSSVVFSNATRGWIVGEFGVIFQTQNGGKSWNKQKSPVEVSFASGESRNLFAVLFPKPDDGWAFGLDGVVLKSRGGSGWKVARQQEKTGSSPGANHLFAAAAFDGGLWAVGERGTLLQSDADGNRWRQAPAEITRASLNGIAFGKDGFGLVVGNRGVILRTDNSGTTWQRLKISPQNQGKGLPAAP
jgi:photosystem II stability/assembly factor-like uncharacterized protein